AGEPCSLLLPIPARDTEQHADATPDLAARRDPSTRHALHHRSHAAKLVQLADARTVLRRSRPQRARELVVPIRLHVPSLLLEAATQGVVRVLVDRRQLDHLAELLFGLAPSPDPE